MIWAIPLPRLLSEVLFESYVMGCIRYYFMQCVVECDAICFIERRLRIRPISALSVSTISWTAILPEIIRASPEITADPLCHQLLTVSTASLLDLTEMAISFAR